MLTETLAWLLSWIPPLVAGGILACRATVRPHLRLLGAWYGAMLYAAGVCVVAGFTPIGMTRWRVLALSAAGAAALAVWAWRTRTARGPVAPPIAPRRPRFRVSLSGVHLAGLVVVAAALLGWLTWLSLLLPPHFCDAVTTHSVSPLAWYFDQAFSWPVRGFWSRSGIMNGYIKLPNFLFYYNVLGPGTHGFMTMGQWQGLVLTMLAVYATVRELGGGRNAGWLGALGVFSAPEIVIQTLDCYTDVLVAGSLAVALLGVVLAAREPGWRSLAAFTMACAAAVAVKSPSLVQVMPLWITVCLWGAWRMRREGWPRVWRTAAGCAGLMLVVGGFFYIVSWIRLGNPIYPFEVRFGGTVIIRGALDVSGGEAFLLDPVGLTRWSAVPVAWGERVGGTSLGSPFSGLGPMFVVLGLPALLAGLVAALRRRRTDVALLVAAVVLLFVVHPSRWQPRYTLYLMPAACVAIAWVWHLGGRGWRAVVSLAVLVGVLGGFARSVPYQVAGFKSPPVYWLSALSSRTFAELGSRFCLPDARPVQQRLMYHPDYAGKTIMVDTLMGAGSLSRRRMDSRLVTSEFRDERQYLAQIATSGADFVYHTEGEQLGGTKILAALQRHPELFRSVIVSSPDVRLQTSYMNHPGNREHLFAVNREALASWLGGEVAHE